jgi:predicted GTPase
MTDVKNALAQLPPMLHAAVQVVADKTVQVNMPLAVCVVGEFSTGKSSLINALLGDALLPTAREETTALPTFIEYSPELHRDLISADGTTSAITQEQFSQYTVVAPENALCSVLHYPAVWLKDLTLIDLPGLGSQSQRHSDYTHAQVSAADAIIYLLSSRGTTQGDLKLLRLIKQYGKHVIIAVAQWDKIEESIKEGEQAPDLQEWQARIAEETELNLALIGVSKYGHGRDAIIDFLQTTKQGVAAIREKRFQAELVPLLNNALGKLQDEQAVYSAASVEQQQALQHELLSQRQALLKIKSDVYERSNVDQSELEQQAQQLASDHRTGLTVRLRDFAVVRQNEEWQVFTDFAYQQLQGEVIATADGLKALSTHYGQLPIPAIDVKKFNLHLPSPEPIELDAFVNISRLSALQADLEQKEHNADNDRAIVQALSAINTGDSLQQLSELQAERDHIARQELPRTTQVIEGNDNNAKIFKNIGHLLDIGLIFVEGPLVAAKAASLLGETSKVLKVVNGANKVAKVIKSPELEPYLRFSEKLSLSYWGEQLGKRFDQPAEMLEVVDPYAEAEQRRRLQEQDQQIAKQRAELHRLEDLQQQRDNSDWALAQNLKEQEQLKASIQLLQQQAVIAQQEAQADAFKQQQTMIAHYREQLINQSIIHFDQQTRPMLDLLRITCKRYWQEQVEATLAQRLQTVDDLTQQLQQAPEEKQAALLGFQQQLTQIQSVLNALRV